MYTVKYLPLKFLDGNRLKVREERFLETRKELESFLENERHLHTKAFAKDVMFSHEIKANNQVEGYFDDVNVVKSIIENRYKNLSTEQKQRVLNLWHGYHFILRETSINKETLKKLYSILSKNLLNEEDKRRMGEYYRTDKVYILNKGRLDDTMDEGIPHDRIEEFLNYYFEFLNSTLYSQDITDEYIKSQILHFYFVYIHPYFDVNGRTSRTVAMWHLLNKKAYPYIIFNRGINFKGSGYDTAIKDVKKFRDISYFIEYMLQTVQIELEKEYIMQNITGLSDRKFSATDWQTLLYILSMKSMLTVKDFAVMYNRFNSKKKVKDIYETMLDPLIQDNVLNVIGTTGTYMFSDTPNETFVINPKLLDYNREKIRRLERYK